MFRHNFIPSIMPLATALALSGCATQAASQQLTEARVAYQNALTGPAATEVPAKVHEAKVALERAERAHEREAQSRAEQDLAYIAQRKALLAQQEAERRMALRKVETAEQQKAEVLRQQRDSARHDLQTAESSLHALDSELDEARDARTQAEREARDALDSLQRIAAVQAEQDRMVITLSGSVLFETDKAVLLPIARNRLDTVAEALKAQGDDKRIQILGYTDARGSEAYNEKLSRERAEAVREYLTTQGIGADRIEAVGRGEADPIASNDSPEGRANNRRVEIVIENPKTAAR